MRAIRKPLSYILAFVILLSIIVVFPNQTKAAEVCTQETGAVLDIEAVGDSVNLHVWISDSPMGEVPETFIYGHHYYLCYELTNLTTGGLLNGYNYKVDMKFTQGNRNLYSYQYTNSNKNWIGHTFNESGLCGGTVTVSGDVGIESSISFSVQRVGIRAWFSDTGMGEKPSKYRLDNRYYLCYELINPETNNRVEGLSISVEETITRPDNTTFSYTYNNSNNNWISNVFDQVGTYGGSVKVSGDISGSISISAQINRVSLSDCTITISQTSYAYDGKEKKPSVTVKDRTKMLTNGTDYTVSYSNNTNVGTATATVTGKGNYEGSVNKTFTISYETISLNATKTINITAAGSVRYFSYKPSSNMSVKFYSTGSCDSYGYVYDSNLTQLSSNDDGGENRNFLITYDLVANKQYIFACKMYSSGNTGTFDIKLEQYNADTQKPTVSLSSSNNVSFSQTVTLSLSDNVGIKGYYWGTSSNYSNNSYTSTSSTSVSKTVDASGTYYATAVDTSGNVSSIVSITFYKTTLNPNANDASVSPTSVLTKSGNSFTFPTPTRSNYTYVGWSTSSSATSGVKTLSPTSNTTYYAVWSYVDSQKPTASLSTTNNVASSQTVTISLSDNVGIKGYYWGTSSNYSNNTYTTTSNTGISKTVDSAGTYYATAVDSSGNVSSTVSITFYKTTLNANGGSVSPTSVLTKSGNSFTFPTPTRSGYTYVGWSTSSSATSGAKTLSPTSNTTYYAVWSPVDSQKPTVSLSATNNVASSQTVTISLSDNVGIKGYYWGTSSNYSNNTYTTTSNTSISKTVSSAGTYYVTAVDTAGNVSSVTFIKFYKTTLNANGGSVSPTAVLTKAGNSFTFPTPTRNNYTYKGWAKTTSSTSTIKTLEPISNETYYAIWEYIDTQNPTVSLSSTNNVASSQTVTIRLSDNIGIIGYYWGTSTDNIYNSFTSTSDSSDTKTVSTSGTYYVTAVDSSYNMSSPVSITFYKTTLNANGGSVSPTSVLTKSGNSFTFPTPTRSNYAYVGWSTSSSATSGVKTLSPSSNATYYAVWKTKTPFVWGKDNWNINNWDPDYFPSTTFREQMSEQYLNKLADNLNNTDYGIVFCNYNTVNGKHIAWLDRPWKGSCYGMSATTFLAKEGLLPYSQYKQSATNLNDLGYSQYQYDYEVLSLINYYQMLQIRDVTYQQYYDTPKKGNEANIKNILSLLDTHSTVMVGVGHENGFGHELLAYGYEYGSWTKYGITYNGRIKICDPNRSTNNYSTFEDSHLYFNSKTYSWMIPLYYQSRGIFSGNGMYINHICANIDEVNEGGYLSGNSFNNQSNYISRLDAYKISDNRSVSKVKKDNYGNYMNNSSGEDDIEAAYSVVMNGDSVSVAGYNLRDSESSYKVVQYDPVTLDLSLKYQNCLLAASSSAGKSVVFDKMGVVQIESEQSDYTISMTFNDNYATDWFSIDVLGHGAESAKMEMTKDGYILTSDSLNEITIRAFNREHTANTCFSTNYDSVFIYEIDENTIGLKVDTDGNGTYETELPTNTFQIGDTNCDGKINVRDVTAIQRHVADSEKLTGASLLAADTNGDGKVDINDATHLQMYLAEFDVVLDKRKSK